MGLPYQTEDYDEVGGGGSGSASTVNDLGGMNFSSIQNNEMLKRVDANNVGGSDLYSTSTTSGNQHYNILYSNVNNNQLGSILIEKNNTTYNVELRPNPNTSNSLIVKEDGTGQAYVGINVLNPEEALDIEGNLELRGGSGKIFFKHPSGLQKVELDGDQDGTNGGKFIVKTKEDGGSMTEKLTINNIGAIGIGSTPNYGASGNFLMSSGSGASPTWYAPEQKIITSVKKTATLSFTSGTVTPAQITNWNTPHVTIGPSGWSAANSRYTIQRTGTYRINLKAIINNNGNDQSQLRYLNVSIYTYNSNGTTAFIDGDTTVLVNVDNNAGYVERGSADYTIIRTLNAAQYLEFRVASLESTGSYNIESAVFNIEEIGETYPAGVGQFLGLTGGTLTGSITAPTYKTNALPSSVDDIGYNTTVAIPANTTISNTLATIASITLNAGVWKVKAHYTVNGSQNANYPLRTDIYENLSPVPNYFTIDFKTIIAIGGYQSVYVADTITVPYGTTRLIEIRAQQASTDPNNPVITPNAGKLSVFRIA